MPFQGQWKHLYSWYKTHENAFFDVLQDKYILFGEWCYACHSIFYDSLPDWFIAFDVYDLNNDYFLSAKKRNELLIKMEINAVPLICFDKIDINNLNDYIGKSKFGSSVCEGIYIRYDNEEQLIVRAKYVKEGFIQSIEEHWNKSPLFPNKLAL